MEEIRALAKAHRAGDAAAGERLLQRVEALPLPEARGVVKAFASYFQLVNLAEEQERVRILRRRARRPTARAARGRDDPRPRRLHLGGVCPPRSSPSWTG